MEADRISNLPLDLSHKILECLSTYEAAKISVLSKHWRFQWASNPHLILDELFFWKITRALDESFGRNITRGLDKSLCRKRKITRGKYVLVDLKSAYSNVVNNIINSRVGPISKFVLYVPYWFPEETYVWIQNVCANNSVKEFTLFSDTDRLIALPTCLFSCSGLTHLTLTLCKLVSLPTTFKAFPCLVYLTLQSVKIRGGVKLNVLETLISRCPQLESLYLTIYETDEHLTIHAPKLNKLVVIGSLSGLLLAGGMALITLSLGVELLHFDINNFSNCFAKVENLVLFDIHLMAYIPNNPSIIFPKLRTLDLARIRLCSWKVPSILRLLKSTTQLKRLIIGANDSRDVYCFHSMKVDCRNKLQCLKYAQLVDFSGLKFELQLLKYIVANSPALEEMSIELSAEMREAEEKFNSLTEAMQHCRASSNAEIIIKFK